MLSTSGNKLPVFDDRFGGGTATQHSALVVDKYMTIGANIDVHLREKIQGHLC